MGGSITTTTGISSNFTSGRRQGRGQNHHPPDRDRIAHIYICVYILWLELNAHSSCFGSVRFVVHVWVYVCRCGCQWARREGGGRYLMSNERRNEEGEGRDFAWYIYTHASTTYRVIDWLMEEFITILHCREVFFFGISNAFFLTPLRFPGILLPFFPASNYIFDVMTVIMESFCRKKRPDGHFFLALCVCGPCLLACLICILSFAISQQHL